MAAVLNAFKLKEFDLEPTFAEWKDAPVFTGNPKKDLPVDDWMEKIREGCVARGIPEEYWYKVAQHYMGPKAKARLDELKQVIVKVHGGKYRWTWKKFTVAMQNMGWTIDKDAKETIKVTKNSSGLWFSRKNNSEPVEAASSASTSSNAIPKPPSRSNSIFSITKKAVVEEPEEQEFVNIPAPPKKALSRARSTTVSGSAATATATTSTSSGSSGFWPSRLSKATEDNDPPRRPSHQKARSDSEVITQVKRKGKSPARSETTADGHASGQVTTVTQAPTWLLNACTALEYITNEHPKAMSIVSAVLITIGSIPAIPAIAAGAGGAVLASSTAHAVGALAVGLGQALGSTVKKDAGGNKGAGSGHSDGNSNSGHGSSRVR